MKRHKKQSWIDIANFILRPITFLLVMLLMIHDFENTLFYWLFLSSYVVIFAIAMILSIYLLIKERK